uniref:phospholipase A2 n=1 Tax=Crocodylus porosus TaxID=8502 RepID=A0A7M4FKH5_CROPO
ARNIKGTDLLSKADCYVELKLPAASPVTSQTQVVDNSSDPEWNETFQYRIHSAVKNILELTLFDKDVLISDELTSVVFDVGGLKPGQPLKRVFKLNPEVSPFTLDTNLLPLEEIIDLAALGGQVEVCGAGGAAQSATLALPTSHRQAALQAALPAPWSSAQWWESQWQSCSNCSPGEYRVVAGGSKSPWS